MCVTCVKHAISGAMSSLLQVKRKLEMDGACPSNRVRRRLSSTCSSEELRKRARWALLQTHLFMLSPLSLSLSLSSLSTAPRLYHRLLPLHRAAARDVSGHAHEEVLRPPPRVPRRRPGPQRGRGDAPSTEETHLRHHERAGGRGAHIQGLKEPHTLEVSPGGRDERE